MNRLKILVTAVFGVLFVSCNSNNNVSNEKNIVAEVNWLDTSGELINAHGGGVMFYEGKYYWYGEHKGDSTYRLDQIKSWECYRAEAGGVSCYSSENLYDWTFEGIALTTSDDPTSDLHPSQVIERPKVIYNDKTGKFVMWMHIESQTYEKAHAGVAISDTPIGPFKYLGSIKPNGEDSRDQTLFKDDDGRAYHIYSSESNKTLYISLLDGEYLNPSGVFTRNFENLSREAPAVFKRNGRYYIISSGCTGWDPNVAEIAVADSMLGQWTILGDPCRGPLADKTFMAQSTFVLPVEGIEDAYVALFDQWNKTDLINSRYLWLPITFEGDMPIVNWNPSWNMSFFEK